MVNSRGDPTPDDTDHPHANKAETDLRMINTSSTLRMINISSMLIVNCQQFICRIITNAAIVNLIAIKGITIC